MSNRFTTLDGLRGVAAITVVMFHAAPLLGEWHPHSAYLAVDFFFALSGFVLAEAYAGRFAVGMSLGAFLRLRAVRLLPIYWVGTLLGLAIAAGALFVLRDAGPWTTLTLLEATPFALLLLPAPVLNATFPLNVPSWSLFCEVIANVLIAYATRMQVTRWLLAVTAVSLGVTVYSALLFGDIGQGWEWPNAGWAIPRVLFSFCAGILVHRVRLRLPRLHVPSIPLVVLLTALMFAAPTGGWRTAFDIVFVAVLSPAVVLLGATNRGNTGRLSQSYEGLGLISYPLYIIHFPVVQAASALAKRTLPNATTSGLGPLLGILLVMALTVAAYALAKVDHGMRHWFARLIAPPSLVRSKEPGVVRAPR